jgi:hypothetical protein
MPKDNYVKVKRFGVFSVARTGAVFGIVIGVIALIIALAVSALGLTRTFSPVVGVGVGVALLIGSVIGFFVCGAIEAFLYNVIARIVGPVRIVLTKNVIESVNPLSYAKVTFGFTLIVYAVLGLLVSSVLLATIGISTAAHVPIALIGAAFVFILIIYGLILPYVWGLVYNWLAKRMGGIGIVLRKGVLESIDIESFVKVMFSISIIILIIERIVGTVVGLASGLPSTTSVFAAVVGFVVAVVALLVIYALAAWFYNVVAKRFGGIEIGIAKE